MFQKHVGGVAFTRMDTFCDGQSDRQIDGLDAQDKTKCLPTLTRETMKVIDYSLIQDFEAKSMKLWA